MAVVVVVVVVVVAAAAAAAAAVVGVVVVVVGNKRSMGNVQSEKGDTTSTDRFDHQLSVQRQPETLTATVSTNHNLFEEKGKPKRYRTEHLPLTSLTPYR